MKEDTPAEQAMRATRSLRAAAMRTLMRTVDEDSICEYEHDPICTPQDSNDYALCFVTGLLGHAEPRTCYWMIKGLEESHFPGIDDEEAYEDLEDSEPLSEPCQESEETFTRESLEEYVTFCRELNAEKRRREQRIASVMTWKRLLFAIEPEVVLDRLQRHGVELQLTWEGAFRAAAKIDDVVFDIPGRTKAEAVVKLIILLQLYLEVPLLPWHP